MQTLNHFYVDQASLESLYKRDQQIRDINNARRLMRDAQRADDELTVFIKNFIEKMGETK